MTDIILITSQPVAHLSSNCKCPHCLVHNDIERVFVAMAITESPEIWANMSVQERKEIVSQDEAKLISTRLHLTDKTPYVICDECGQPIYLAVKHETHKMEVAALLSCPECEIHIDLRLPRDAEKVHFTSEYPNVPFVRCRNCKAKILLPIRGRESWRNQVFKLVSLIKKFKAALF